jgi:tetratricopeptide (TPR) repeat protein
MRSRLRPLPRSRFRPRPGLALACLLLLLTPTLARAQITQSVAPSTASPMADAYRAIRSGRYDEVETLLASIREEAASVLRADAHIARGRYDEAEAVLSPLAAANPAGDAALELGLIYRIRGRRADSDRLLVTVLERNARGPDQDRLVRAARAARALSRFEQANEMFRAATMLGVDDPMIPTGWGELFLEKHNQADALRSFRQALQVDRGYPPAVVGLARAMAETNPPMAREIARRALTLNPSFVPAHVLVAELALDDADRAAAAEAVDAALAINPSSLEALSLRASIAFLEDRQADFDEGVAKVLAIHPKYSAVFRVAGAQAARHYRFDDAVALVRRAVALDGTDARAHAELGMHLMRTGDEAGARASLDRAFELDPYDAVTYNLLGLLDTLDTFVTIEDGPIVLRLHPDEAAVLREHALPLAREALRTLSARYGLTPQGPILVELFPRHDDFAVRTLGLPGMIGALGACFGRVVTADSPHARPPNTFSWQATLWHEMAHVVTLQLSRQRVPRWLTEGISVYEEQRARPEWGRDMQVAFAEAMDRDQVLRLAEFDKGFTDPDTIGLAYFQASLVVDHIVRRFGEDKLRALLVAYGEGLETSAAVSRALGVDLDALQASFFESIGQEFGPLRQALEPPPDGQLAGVTGAEALGELAQKFPGSYPVQLALGQALQESGDSAGAIAAYERAAVLVPWVTGEESPRAEIVRIALGAGDTDAAVTALERQLEYDHDNVDAARQLAGLLEPESPRALAAWTRVADLDPFDATAGAALGRHALASGDAATAARWFRTALAARPKDEVAAHCDLAEAYRQLGSIAEAKRQVLAALEIAPTFPRAQDLLLTVVEGQP